MPKNRFWKVVLWLADGFYRVAAATQAWVWEVGTGELTAAEVEGAKRDSEFRDLKLACDVLEGLFAKDPKRAPLAHRAVRMLMQAHYPEEEERYYGGHREA